MAPPADPIEAEEAIYSSAQFSHFTNEQISIARGDFLLPHRLCSKVLPAARSALHGACGFLHGRGFGFVQSLIIVCHLLSVRRAGCGQGISACERLWGVAWGGAKPATYLRRLGQRRTACHRRCQEQTASAATCRCVCVMASCNLDMPDPAAVDVQREPFQIYTYSRYKLAWFFLTLRSPQS